MLGGASGEGERKQGPETSHGRHPSRKPTGPGVDQWNTPELPALVVGVGFLVARHRRQQRAENERRQSMNRRARSAGDEEGLSAATPRLGLAGIGLASGRVAGRRAGSPDAADTRDGSKGGGGGGGNARGDGTQGEEEVYAEMEDRERYGDEEEEEELEETEGWVEAGYEESLDEEEQWELHEQIDTVSP